MSTNPYKPLILQGTSYFDDRVLNPTPWYWTGSKWSKEYEEAAIYSDLDHFNRFRGELTPSEFNSTFGGHRMLLINA